MKRRSIVILFLLLIFSVTAFSNQTGVTASIPEKGVEWYEVLGVIIALGYVLGVVVLLPIVIYTNIRERISIPDQSNNKNFNSQDLTMEQRNDLTRLILEQIENKLTGYKDENGEEMITITKGNQARFVKRGLDYIIKKLKPTDVLLQSEVEKMANMYIDRTKRVFSGSYWIIGCSIFVGLLFGITGFAFVSFLIIHFLGLLFYILSSRMPRYNIDSFVGKFSWATGIVGFIVSSLFIGNEVRYYIKEGNGPWKRDWETEGTIAAFWFVIMAIVACFFGLLAAFFGVINFIINYMSSFILPFFSDEKWFRKNFDLSSYSALLVNQ